MGQPRGRAATGRRASANRGPPSRPSLSAQTKRPAWIVKALRNSERLRYCPAPLGGRGMTLGSISVGSRADFEAMNRAIALHHLRPVVDDRVLPFDEAPDAYRYSESRAHFGKVVISHG
jgi:NADPH:quinone reductase-like Zn-dependent oxidoreductase